MATVRPFKAVRPARERVQDVISLPYDVMNRSEAAAMAEGNPHSFLHICRSEMICRIRRIRTTHRFIRKRKKI